MFYYFSTFCMKGSNVAIFQRFIRFLPYLFKPSFQVIVRCVRDHPHHSLFILLALCNADLDQRITKAGKGGKLSASRGVKCDDHRIDKVLLLILVEGQLLIVKGEKMTLFKELENWHFRQLKSIVILYGRVSNWVNIKL